MEIIGERFILDNSAARVGGMAHVRKGVDQRNNFAPVAVKFMTSSRVRDDRVVALAFQRELEALNKLQHPNIVKIVDFDARASPPYIVLEWLESDLNSSLQDGAKFTWDEFFDSVGAPLLDALAHAFTHNIAHRDIKPGNILLDEAGTIKIGDFGIAKLNLGSGSIGGQTLAQYKSEPYAPLEELSAPSARDPYSFAVLALRCTSGVELKTHEDVSNALATFAGPQAVHSVLKKALASAPHDRFHSIIELQDEIQEARKQFVAASTKLPTIYIAITPVAISLLSNRLQRTDERRTRDALERDIRDCLSIATTDSDLLIGRTPRFRIHLNVSPRNRDHLIISKAWPSSDVPDTGFRPSCKFVFSTPPAGVDSQPSIRRLLESIEQHEQDEKSERLSRRDEELFREWEATLRFKQTADNRRNPPIRYHSRRIEGRRIIFQIENLPDGVAIDQPRRVKNERYVLSGVIDDFSPSFVTLWTEREIGPAHQIPERGQIEFDDRAARTAIDRQKSALDAVRYCRSVNPQLRRLISDPSTATPPPSGPEPVWQHSDFDDDKKAAVRKALTVPEVLVVQGPPGTGKTRLISELITQLLGRDPECRILLTSQTHVALDNVIERLRQLRPNTQVIRVAQREDSRVAESVRDCLIENVGRQWSASIDAQSEKCLTDIALEQNIDTKAIALGIAVGRLRTEKTQYESIQDKITAIKAELRDAEVSMQIAKVQLSADGYQETKERITELRDKLQDLQSQRDVVQGRMRDAAQQLKSIGGVAEELASETTAELAQWEAGLLGETEAHRNFHKLVQIAEDWQIQFAASKEFYSTIVASSSVVAGTCLGFARVKGMLSAEFDVCIVDEASKATATELLVPLSRARRWILVGDPRQLPPFVEDLLDDKQLLEQHGLNRDSFQRTLLDRFIGALPSECVSTLTTQHRMVAPIGSLISSCFYDGKLQNARGADPQILSSVIPKHVTWLSTTKQRNRFEIAARGSFENRAEVDCIADWIRRFNMIATQRKQELRVAVITGYAKQADVLERRLASLSCPALSIDCNTVDAFQGREADICVYSITRCNKQREIGFLRDIRRLNVALSRGRLGLVIVGDHLFCREALGHNPLRLVLDYIESHPVDCALEVLAP
jgi:serine/threonine protein kinase